MISHDHLWRRRALGDGIPGTAFRNIFAYTRPANIAAFDYAAIKAAVAKTGKVLLLHEDSLTGGIGGEISAWISEHCFELLDAPVMRCASMDTPIPFNIELEKNFMAN
jgi:pyruvate/2-oxoglutarate/acetoin dehydrogenase E1 component